MKFDMKKRILALALAGTTAFSVFGAAMSANAASTHVVNEKDAYTSYTAVKKITATATTEETNSTIYSYKNANGDTVYTNDEDPKIDVSDKQFCKKISAINDGVISYDETTVADVTDLIAAGMSNTKGFYLGTPDAATAQVGEWVKDATLTSLYDTGTVIAVSYGNITNNAVKIYTTTKPTTTDTGLKGKADGKSYTEEGAATGSLTLKDVDDGNVTDDFSETWNLTLTDIMDVTVVPGTVYLYDFYYTNDALNDYNDLKKANGSAAKLAAVLGDGTDVLAETGVKYVYKDERTDVLDEWVEFLYDLSINNDNGYSETLAEFVNGYTNMYYGEPVYSEKTGKLLYYTSVDLYNISGLLEDIYAYSTAEAENNVGGVTTVGYSNANTSELIYLMQQYDKYVGTYFDKDEYSTDEWGDLLVSLLEAVTEDDLKNSAKDYKKFTNKVEDLVDAYENATSTTQITKAEEEMYALLTSVPYTAASTVSKADLSATLYSLYFNTKSLPSTYSTAATFDNGVTAYGLTGTTYTLYPMADYIDYDTTTPNEVYAGNKGTSAFEGKYATEEYEWFYNIYELAYNMNKSNKYQGAIDAVTEALEDAVAALSATVLPAGSNVAAKEEMVDKYAGKIESDYYATYYGYYTLANDFADVAEGAAQTKNATNMVKEAGSTLGYQGAQVDVTKNDINSVKSAISDANKALTAIKSDANYSAAQVTALNKAIANAQVIIDLYNGNYSNSASYQSVNTLYTSNVGDKDQILKSDIDAAIAGIESAINYSEVVMGWNQTANGWTYGTEDGYVESGWKQINSVWYYFENGVALQSTWKQIDGKWYYLNSNCGAAYGWAKVDGSWYYLNAGGKMVTGWAEVNGTWYYFSKESNALGQMLANTTTPDGYTVDANGALVD
jgi:glucan-binding YG repeat protein